MKIKKYLKNLLFFILKQLVNDFFKIREITKELNKLFKRVFIKN